MCHRSFRYNTGCGRERTLHLRRGPLMSTNADKLASEIRELPEAEKLRLVDAILTDLDKPDPEIDRIWADEARQRWAAYKEGRIPTVSYDEVMSKHRAP